MDWNAPDSFLAALRGVSEHWIRVTLVDVAYYVMAQDVAGRLAPLLEQERRHLYDLEQQKAQKVSKWQIAQERLEAAKAELAQLPDPATFEQEQPVLKKIGQASQEAAVLAAELTRLDESLNKQREKVCGMAQVRDGLLAAKMPELGDMLGLNEFLTSARDDASSL